MLVNSVQVQQRNKLFKSRKSVCVCESEREGPLQEDVGQ
jgi:hypothetical protein